MFSNVTPFIPQEKQKYSPIAHCLSPSLGAYQVLPNLQNTVTYSRRSLAPQFARRFASQTDQKEYDVVVIGGGQLENLITTRELNLLY